MYDNIGRKIKDLSKIIFIIEALGAIITGVLLLATDDDLILLGVHVLICGPLVAWISSWILYAFSELVEDIHIIRYQAFPSHQPQIQKTKTYTEQGIATEPTDDRYICPICKMAMDTHSPCERCGYIPPTSN